MSRASHGTWLRFRRTVILYVTNATRDCVIIGCGETYCTYCTNCTNRFSYYENSAPRSLNSISSYSARFIGFPITVLRSVPVKTDLSIIQLVHHCFTTNYSKVTVRTGMYKITQSTVNSTFHIPLHQCHLTPRVTDEAVENKFHAHYATRSLKPSTIIPQRPKPRNYCRKTDHRIVRRTLHNSRDRPIARFDFRGRSPTARVRRKFDKRATRKRTNLGRKEGRHSARLVPLSSFGEHVQKAARTQKEREARLEIAGPTRCNEEFVTL